MASLTGLRYQDQALGKPGLCSGPPIVLKTYPVGRLRNWLDFQEVVRDGAARSPRR